VNVLGIAAVRMDDAEESSEPSLGMDSHIAASSVVVRCELTVNARERAKAAPGRTSQSGQGQAQGAIRGGSGCPS